MVISVVSLVVVMRLLSTYFYTAQLSSLCGAYYNVHLICEYPPDNVKTFFILGLRSLVKIRRCYFQLVFQL